MQQKELAVALNVSPAAVTKWITEKSTPTPDMADAICKVLNITMGDLVLDNGSEIENKLPSKTIPLYNSIYANKNFFEESNIARYLTLDISAKADFGMIVNKAGAGINIGDIAFFTKNYTYTEGKIYAVMIMERNSIAMKHVYIRDNKYLLLPANINTPKIEVDNDKAFIIGELVGVYKRINQQ